MATLHAQPTNDSFANRTVIADSNFYYLSYDNTTATKEPGEPDHAGNAGGKSLWWSWTAPVSGPFTIATTYESSFRGITFTYGSNFDTTLAVYTGAAVDALTLVAGNHTFSTGSGRSSVTFQASAGVTYQIAVDGFNGANGTGYLDMMALPPGDLFAGRITLTGAPGSTTANNTQAFVEEGEPISVQEAGAWSMWWSWTAPVSGNVTFSTMGSDFPTSLAVFTGDALNSLALVVKDFRINYSSPGSSQVTFRARAGVAYQIRVGGYSGFSTQYIPGFGHIALSWTAPDPGNVPALFNWQAYLAANPDVAAALGSNPVAAWNHYLDFGVYEGRTDGNVDIQAYLAQYPDLAARYGTDLTAAALSWYTESLAPVGFSVAGYFLRNADVAAVFVNDPYGAWLHYYNYGIFEGRSFDANFIPAEYLELNPDLKAAFGSNWQAAVMHWFNYGHPVEDRMGRVPIGFNVDSYLARYPDLQAVFGGITPTAVRNVTVWHHYIDYGTMEGRSDGDFEAYNYLATNPDLAAVFGTDIRGAALHWYFYGRREGRRIPEGFDVVDYRARYPDIVVGLGDDLYGSWIHYRDTGVNENRVFGELFRPAEYLALNPDVAAVVGPTNYRDALLHWLYYGQYEGRPGRY